MIARLEAFSRHSYESCGSSDEESGKEVVGAAETDENEDDHQDSDEIELDSTDENYNEEQGDMIFCTETYSQPTTTSPPICTEEYTFLPGCVKEIQSCGNCPRTHKSTRDLAARAMRFDMSVVSFCICIYILLAYE